MMRKYNLLSTQEVKQKAIDLIIRMDNEKVKQFLAEVYNER